MFRWDVYARRRESLLIGYDLRGVLYLLLEPYLWTSEALAALTGGTSKVILFLVYLQICALQRPRAAALRSVVLTPPTLWAAMYQAQPGGEGVEWWIYRARHEGGWCLLVVAVVYAMAHLAFGLAVASVTDLWSRRAFIRQQRLQRRQG